MKYKILIQLATIFFAGYCLNTAILTGNVYTYILVCFFTVIPLYNIFSVMNDIEKNNTFHFFLHNNIQ